MHHRDTIAKPFRGMCAHRRMGLAGRHVPRLHRHHLAKAHYRTLRYGRKINVFNRVAPSEHTIKVGPITVTTPVRTACDLALNCVPETESKVSEIICMLMQEFHFRSNDCMQIMEDAKHIRNAPQARNYILAIDGRGYEHGNRKDCEDRKNRKDAEYVRGA